MVGFRFFCENVKYFDLKDQSSLGCEVPQEAAQSQAATATHLLALAVAGAAHPSPLMDPQQGGQVR